MDEKTFDQQIKDRGMSIKGFVVESVTLDDESNKKIDEYELSSNTAMQRGKLVGSYGDAVKDAANNANGAANGLFGVGMMNMASGGVLGGAAMGAFQDGGNAQQGAAPMGYCTKCGTALTGPFCSKCGTKAGE